MLVPKYSTQNLISNSLNYSRSEVAPHITITASLIQGKDTGVVLGDYEKAKDFWQIKLRENSQGFNQELAQQVFKIFQGLPQHLNECSGTGIGLAWL
jgi:light-regulated signal transduction histidine kinase (bacteriophytochrome)